MERTESQNSESRVQIESIADSESDRREHENALLLVLQETDAVRGELEQLGRLEELAVLRFLLNTLNTFLSECFYLKFFLFSTFSF